MRYLKISFLLLAAAITFTACQSKKEETPEMNQSQNQTAVKEGHQVKVLEATNASNYTYFRVEENGKEYWIAAPQMDAAVGMTLYYTGGMEMPNFESKALNKTFDKILFIDKVSTTPNEGVMESPHARGLTLEKTDVKIEPVSGGITIAELYAKKDQLEGKTVRVRGKVTKFNPEIMDKNWVHLQDGTGDKTNNNFDIMATTKGQAATGEVVVIEGTLRLKQDFGAGYYYDVMIEDAKVKK
ncbi:MAG: GW dipeptide domain-containing protein [Ignavibacteriaceae bacterium]|nr:GW dipeptide domain-containing protein [Ignavibacteriaceae bacterium]